MHETYGYEIKVFVFNLSGKTIVLPTLVTRHLRRFFLGMDSLPSYHYGGFLCQEPLSDDELMYMAYRINRLWSLHTLRISDDTERSLSALSAFEATRFTTQILNLSNGFTYIEKHNFDNKQRNSIRKAIRSGVSVEIDNSISSIDNFYNLYLQSCKRWGLSNHEPKNFFTKLISPNSPAVQLWSAILDGQIIACMIIANNDSDTLYYLYGASDDKKMCYCPNNLLLASVIDLACQKGYQKFDLLPSGRIPGVERFKASFGADKVSVPEYWLSGRFPRIKKTMLSKFLKH